MTRTGGYESPAEPSPLPKVDGEPAPGAAPSLRDLMSQGVTMDFTLTEVNREALDALFGGATSYPDATQMVTVTAVTSGEPAPPRYGTDWRSRLLGHNRRLRRHHERLMAHWIRRGRPNRIIKYVVPAGSVRLGVEQDGVTPVSVTPTDRRRR